MIFDGHSDLLYDVTRRRLRGETHVLERHHLDDLRRGGVEGMVLSLWTSAPGETFWKETDCRTAAERTARMMDCARAEFAQCPWLTVVRTAAEARAARAAIRGPALCRGRAHRPDGPELLDEREPFPPPVHFAGGLLPAGILKPLPRSPRHQPAVHHPRFHGEHRLPRGFFLRVYVQPQFHALRWGRKPGAMAEKTRETARYIALIFRHLS